MFEQFTYSSEQIKKYYLAAARDFDLAASAGAPEVVFYLCYNVIVKAAIAICAKNGLRVKSRVGHHIELITKLAEYLESQEIEEIAYRMRVKRNRDLYDGGTITTEKEAKFYLIFCKDLIKKVDFYLFSK